MAASPHFIVSEPHVRQVEQSNDDRAYLPYILCDKSLRSEWIHKVYSDKGYVCATTDFLKVVCERLFTFRHCSANSRYFSFFNEEGMIRTIISMLRQPFDFLTHISCAMRCFIKALTNASNAVLKFLLPTASVISSEAVKYGKCDRRLVSHFNSFSLYLDPCLVPYPDLSRRRLCHPCLSVPLLFARRSSAR